MSEKVSLGEFIAMRRKHMFLTQEELAEKILVSKSAIAKWETNGGLPDRDNLYKLAEIMEVSVNDLHRMIMSSRYKQENKDVNITSEVIAILESYGYYIKRPEEIDKEEVKWQSVQKH